MGETTGISWCDSTVNYWEGCDKVSPGCANCYAWIRDVRFNNGKHWGKSAPRQWHQSAVKLVTSLNKLPFVCDTCGKATKSKDSPVCSCTPQSFHTRRVFSLSLGDLFDPAVPDEYITRALYCIYKADQIHHLIVTKRPELFKERLNVAIEYSEDHMRQNKEGFDFTEWIRNWIDGHEAPQQVWMLTTVENQAMTKRIDDLLRIPANIRGLSVEPMLEPINLGLLGIVPKTISPRYQPTGNMIHWVIVGGESGKNARSFNLNWARGIRNECERAGVKFFMKQMGSKPVENGYTFTDKKGGDMTEWPLDLCIHEFPV